MLNTGTAYASYMIEKDPVCGKDVPTDKAIVVLKLGNGKRYRYFCSEKCARIFLKSHLGL
jgi:YHS domain-containing protein